MQPGSHSSGERPSSSVPTTLPHQPTASRHTGHSSGERPSSSVPTTLPHQPTASGHTSHSRGERPSSSVPTTLPHQPTASGHTSHHMPAPALTTNVLISSSQLRLHFPQGTIMEVPVQNPECFPRHLIRGLASAVVITDLTVLLEDFIPFKIIGKLQNSLYHAFFVDIKVDVRLSALFGLKIFRPGFLSPKWPTKPAFHLEFRPVLGPPNERWYKLILIQ